MKAVAVVVTYNRLACLQKALLCYQNQELPFEKTVVVDNCSTDGTAAYLDAWAAADPARRTVSHLATNTGGSGGFAAGMALAMADPACDWVWLADDDAYLRPDTLRQLADFAAAHPAELGEAGALCTAIIDHGHFALDHRRRVRPFAGLIYREIPVPAGEYERDFFALDIYSFVGTLVRRADLCAVGPCRADFFISYDDSEHALRLGAQKRILCVPAAVVDHDCNYCDDRTRVSWRDYYGTRNLLWAYKQHYGTAAFALRAAGRLLTALSSGDGAKIRQCATAIADAGHGRLGIHPVYKPGWKKQETGV